MSIDLFAHYSAYQQQFARPSSEEQNELSSKDGAFWKCIWSMSNPINTGGKNYIFVAKELTDKEIEEIEKDIYPALELTGTMLMSYCSSNMEFLEKLGYLFQETTLAHHNLCLVSFPDHDALQENWKKLQTENPDLPSLKICASQGIASPEDFIEAFLRGEIVLSTEKEFLHDQELHLIPTLIAISHPMFNYIDTRAKITDSISKVYTLINHAKKYVGAETNLTSQDIDSLLFTLSYLTDIATAYFNQPYADFMNRIQSVKGMLEVMEKRWTAEIGACSEKSFYQRQFGRLSVSEKSFSEILKNIIELAEKDDSLPCEVNNTLNIVRNHISV